jgi:hypothetical protein
VKPAAAAPAMPDPRLRQPGGIGLAGINNTLFRIDPQADIGVVVLMQMLPFYDEAALGGQAVVWGPSDRDPETPSPPSIFSPGAWFRFRHRPDLSAPRWEEDGVSYSLIGRSLTREEAVALFLSLDGHPWPGAD